MTASKTKTILIVDDEKEITDLVEIYLKNEGFNVCKFYRAEGVLDLLKKQSVDLAILDVMLPDQNGFDLLRDIRQNWFMPVIMLTAKIQDTDKITGLTLGADDYITKPFSPLELVARVKTQLRRSTWYNQSQQQEEEDDSICIRGLVIERRSHKALLNGSELDLTPLEFDILWHLCSHQGEVVTSENLFETVWKEKYYESNNTVMAHIARLRSKMKDPARRPKYIKTVWGIGYTIE
jgi:Response regulators consisting of a CheY-like receiver domain and a winged-helix DNA-binding domain